MRIRRIRTPLVLAGALVASIGSPSPSSTQAPAATSVYPIQLLTGEGSGPALFLGTDADAAAVGYISSGVEVEVTGPPEQSRVPVRVRGAMRVRAFLDAARLSARITHRGRIRGTPIYVTGGDIVKVHDIGVDGRAAISVEARVAGELRTFSGTFPIQGLGVNVALDAADTAPPGSPCVLRSPNPFGVSEQPGGAAVVTFPAGEQPCRDLGVDGASHRVLIGTGPYVAGFVTVAPVPASEPPAVEMDRRTAAGRPLPARLAHNAELQLVHVAAGTRVMHENETIAILDQPGYARVVERHDRVHEADVFVAVDDQVAVRGLIDTQAIVGNMISNEE